MRSLQSKFLILIVVCVLLSSLALGCVGIVNMRYVVEEDSAQIMNLLCSEKGQEIDGTLASIEQSVNTIYHYARDQFVGMEIPWGDGERLNNYMGKVREVALNAAENTDGAVAVYMRFAPELHMQMDGFFLTREDGGSFEEHDMTDITQYDPEDIGHVGWYYIPLDNKEATWLEPYENENIGMRMISYVIPVFDGDTTVGVIGMDIDVDILKNSVNSVKIYDTGYAFLAGTELQLYYHREYPEGLTAGDAKETIKKVLALLQEKKADDELISYRWNGEEKRLTYRTLKNGMLLVITAPAEEINASQNRLIRQFVGAAVLIVLLFILVTIYMTGKMIRPLKDLTDAAQKIAGGDLGVSIDCETRDEIGVLSASVRQMVKHLTHYIDYVNKLAGTDALTGVGNKTAYQDAVAELEEKMAAGKARFAVVVLDINNLKKVNDHLGHEYGDMLIRDACSLIQKGFAGNEVFRIGGDEFVVILENETVEQSGELVRNFDTGIVVFNRNNTKYEQKLQVARGIAFYDGEAGESYASVFRRADQAMYENKLLQKQEK